jgi:hypothetical protein
VGWWGLSPSFQIASHTRIALRGLKFAYQEQSESRSVPKHRSPACSKFSSVWVFLLGTLLTGFVPTLAIAQSDLTLGFGPYVSFAGTFDLGYRRTQFFEAHHNAVAGQWDGRIEIWPDARRNGLSWGPYIRVAGIGATQSEAWENGWVGGPGAGLQLYPFSGERFRKRDSRVGNILGPLRFFAELNRVDYWGAENSWRPHSQTRFGMEYWRARNVNRVSAPLWTEIWSGLWRQSSNEFAPHYDTGILANSFRVGARVPNVHVVSTFTPYLLAESTLTDNKTYYWENKLLAGAGLRFAPALKGHVATFKGLNRFALYAEYVHVAACYREQPPSSIPNHDLRLGLTFSFGQWYR